MTRPALLDLTLDEVRHTGGDAPQMTLPYVSNPFYRSIDLNLEEWVAKCAASSHGRAEKDAGRTESMQGMTRSPHR